MISAEQHIVPSLEEHPTARNACFEMFSFDIMLDSKLKAWIMKADDGSSANLGAHDL